MLSQDPGRPNLYNVHTSKPHYFQLPLQHRVEFREVTNQSGKVLKPPSRVLLELHAACAQIAHRSGAAEILDELYRDDGPMNGISLAALDTSIAPAAAEYLDRALLRVVTSSA